MKIGKYKSPKLAVVAIALGLLLTTVTGRALPVGINVQDSNSGGDAVTSTAFNIDTTNWVNLPPFGGNGTTNFTTANGGSLTVSWNAYGTWYTTFSDGIDGDGQVYHGWMEFDPWWNSAPSPGQYYFTISGLNSAFPNGCVVQTVAGDDGCSTFQPTTVTNGSQTLTYSAWLPNTDGALGGVSTVSTVITDDTITLVVPQGAWTAPGGYLQAGTLSGVILRDPPQPAVDAGINFQENNTGLIGKQVTENAFGLSVDNWLNMTPGGSGSETDSLPGGGGSVTVNWSAGSWNTTYTDGNNSDEEIYYGWLDFGWGANSSYVTVSGLNSAFTNGYVIQVAASTDDGEGLEPVTLNGSATVTFSASQSPDGPLGGLSSASSKMTDDSVTLTIPNGTVWPARAAISGIIVAGFPIIQTQPETPTNTLYTGYSFDLSVSAIGPDISYQWQKDGSNISDATNTTYSVASATTEDSGNYDVVISNGYGSVTSSIVAISVGPVAPPTSATASPASQTRYIGGSAYFSVTADGTAPFTYQWNKDGTPIAGATNAALTLFGLSGGDAGNYSCAVSNSVDGVVSSEAALIVDSPQNYQSIVTGDGALAYYRLNEPTPWSVDVAVNSGSIGAAGNGTNFSGVVHGVPGAITGDGDTAMEFSAINSSSDDGGVPTVIPYKAALNPSNSFTVEAWLRPTINGNGNAQCPLINRDPDTAPNRSGWDFFQRDSSTGWNFEMYNGNGNDTIFNITGGAYTVGQWSHLVAVYDASASSATLYLNGVQVAQSTTPNGTFAPNTSFPLSIGGYSDSAQNPFVGDIDEVAIYTNALSSTQVLTHYQNGINSSRGTPYPSLIESDGATEYLRMDGTAQNVAVNSGSLGMAANGVFVGTTTDVAGPQAPAYFGLETNNVAMNFNGNNSRIELGNPAGLNFSGQITMEAWVKPANITSYTADVIAHGVNAANNEEVMMRLTDVPSGVGSAFYQVGVWDGSSAPGTSFTIPAADLSGTNWIYLVGTYDGANWNLYRNGVLVSSQAGAFGAITESDANWGIGSAGRPSDNYASQGRRPFGGGIDEVAIYNYALTPAQIQAHYYMAIDDTTNVPPTFTVQPVSQRVTTNMTATFTASATGYLTPTYQWYEIVGGVTNLISGATSSSYTTALVQDSDTGNGYFVIASNQAADVASDTAILTAGHNVTASGYLRDEIYNGLNDPSVLVSDLYPGSSWLDAHSPDNIVALNSLDNNSATPNGTGERIYGWFTPSVSGNYIFYVASDDTSALWLSTNSDPANVFEVAQNQAWMAGRDWTLENTVADFSSEAQLYPTTFEWRSDQFETTSGPDNAYANFINGWSAWPNVNGDGSIPLVSGQSYYIELDHVDTGDGGREAAVTYKLVGDSDPASGSATLLTGNLVSASVPDSVIPTPQPHVGDISISGSTVTVSGNNGLVNAVYNILTTTDVSLPLNQWTVLSSGRFDSNGNFSSTNAVEDGSQHFYIIEVPSGN